MQFIFERNLDQKKRKVGLQLEGYRRLKDDDDGDELFGDCKRRDFSMFLG